MPSETEPILFEESPLELPPLPAALEWLAGPARFFGWFMLPKPRNVIAWLISVALAAGYLQYAWYMTGYATCDFASQWLMGRMFLVNKGHALYLVPEERPVLNQGYLHEPDKLKELDWQVLTKGHPDKNAEDVVLEGPLYPPTAGLLFAPIALLPPQAAHAVMAMLYLQMACVVGWLLKVITRGRLRAGEGTLLAMVFPNFPVAIVLGQNSMLSLLIVVAGWAVASRGWPLLGGLIWGLLAYKPVFAVALIMVPVVQCRWRMVIGMVVGGGAFVLATLPFLLRPEDRYLFAWNEDLQRWTWVMDTERVKSAFEPWWRWKQVGEHAAKMYTNDPNWVWMSRDLTGLPRRALWDWEHFRAHARYVLAIDHHWDMKFMQAVHDEEIWERLCLGLLVAVGAYTALVCAGTAWGLRRHGRTPSAAYQATRDAFLLIGALFTTYHFMHYDLLLFALPVTLLIDNASRRGWWRHNARVELALGMTLLTCFLFLACAWHAARFMDLPEDPEPAQSVVDNAGSTPAASKPKDQILAEVERNEPPRSAPKGAASAAGSASVQISAQLKPSSQHLAPPLLRWVYFIFVGIVLVVFLGAWIWTAYLQSWMFDAVLWLVLLCSAVDLAYVGPSVRIPFETFLLLIAWVWAGCLTWREALTLIRR
jgi:hypothetical protein